VELWQEVNQTHVCSPNQQKFQHYLGRLADQHSDKTTQHHDNKHTFLVAKPQDSHLACDGKLDEMTDKASKLHQFVYTSDVNIKEWAKYLKRLATQIKADLDEILKETSSTVWSRLPE